jgi:hypothetical protein
MTKPDENRKSSTPRVDRLVMLPSHPCYIGEGEFDHEWQFQDDSFDHEYGGQQVHYWLCEECGAEREMEYADYHDDEGW